MKLTQSMGTLGLFALLAGFASAQAKLEGVTATKTKGGVEVTITGTELGQPKIYRSKQNRSFAMEWPAQLATKPGRKSVNAAGVSYVWHGWYTSRPPKVRVQLWLANGTINPTVTKTETGWLVSVGTQPTRTDSYQNIYKEGSFETLPPINPIIKAVEPKLTPTIDTTPVTTDTTPKNPLIDAKMTIPMKENTTATKTTPNFGDRIVSLEFSNTEISLILKGLAAQAGVNIVTSPDVSGRINVKLDRVTLNEALNFVTTIANVRYTKIGQTYLVTSSARFSDAIRQAIGKLDEAGETRVVTLNSGEGKQIKAATLKALPQLTSTGVYDIIVPTESIKTMSTQTSSVGQPTTNGGGAQPGKGGAQGGNQGNTGGGAEASLQSSAVELSGQSAEDKDGKDPYVVIIATPERMAEVIRFVESLDARITEANNLDTSMMGTRVIPIYSPNAQVIMDSLNNMVMRDPKAAAFKVSLTNNGGGEDGNHLLILTGPSASLDSLETLARATDSGIASALGISVPTTDAEARKSYEVVDLTWIEPIEAVSELQSAIRGLSARLMPAPVDPGVGGKRKIGSVSSTDVQNSQGSGANTQTGGTNGQGGTSSQATQSSGSETETGKVENSMEKALGTEPMKVLLYGTRAQIAQAKSFLASVDIEPRMAAFEIRAVELSKDDATKVGLDWSTVTGGIFNTFSLSNALVTAGSGSLTGSYTNRSTTTTLDLLLDGIVTNNKILARPNTLAMDGRLASIFVGDTVRYIEQVQQSQNGSTITTGKVDVGATFKIVPRISADGTIRVNMHALLSILKGFTPVPNGGQLPQTAERNITNSFIMKSGDVVALGGLIQDSDRVIQQGLPFLKDLPIVGALFRSSTNQRVRSEVVFFITATVVDRNNKSTAADPRTGEKADPMKFDKVKAGFPKGNP